MFNRFMPKEGKFFTLFNQHASLMTATAKEMVTLFQDIENAEVHIQSIREKEKKADAENIPIDLNQVMLA